MVLGKRRKLETLDIMYDNATNVIRVLIIVPPSGALTSHFVSKKQFLLLHLFHTNANREVPCCLSAANMARYSSQGE